MENPSVIKYWYGDIGIEEGENAYQWHLLDEYEQQRANDMGNAQLRRRYISTHARLRELLGKVVNVNPAQLRIHRTQYGKPYLADYPEVAFNLSHTNSTLAVAIAYDCELGIDIELCKPRVNLASLAKKCFGKEELDYWQGLPEIGRALAFYRFWTRKEAFIKAAGRGIALGLNRCVINPSRLDEFLDIPGEFGAAADWQILEIGTDEAIVGALVVSGRKVRTLEAMGEQYRTWA